MVEENYEAWFRRVLSVSALFESEFSIDWIIDLTKLRASSVLQALGYGVKNNWLVKNDSDKYVFSDFQKRQQFQNMIEQQGREGLHRQIVSILLKEPFLDENKLKIVGQHLISTNIDKETATWLLKVANAHLMSFNYGEAADFYEKILADLNSVHEKESDLLFIEAALHYSKISIARTCTEDTVNMIKEAIFRTEKWHQQERHVLLEMHLAKNLWLCSRYQNAVKVFNQAFKKAKAINNSRLVRSAWTFNIFFLYWQGLFGEVLQIDEASTSQTREVPEGGLSLWSGLLVGHCYAITGQVANGLGILNRILDSCQKTRNIYLSANAEVTIGAILLDLGQWNQASLHLKNSLKYSNDAKNHFIQILAKLMLAFCSYKQQDYKRANLFFSEFVQNSREVEVLVHPYAYQIELQWAVRKGLLSAIPGLSFRKEHKRLMKSGNTFLIGVAYYYEAMIKLENDMPQNQILECLNLAIQHIQKSGHLIWLTKVRMELARQYLRLKQTRKARQLVKNASKTLIHLNKDLIPDDLRSIVRMNIKKELVEKELRKVSEEIMTIKDLDRLSRVIISAGNRILGAERGAIFGVHSDKTHLKLDLRTAQNLTLGETKTPRFAQSIKTMENAALAKAPMILESNSTKQGFVISAVVLPLILSGSVRGILYHDSRLLSINPNKSDLKYLGCFSALATLCLQGMEYQRQIQLLTQKCENDNYKEDNYPAFESIVGESTSIKEIFSKIQQVANSETPVLVLGETGVGKEMVARAIYQCSKRRRQRFVRVNCAALPETLIASELFGHEKGAFTGATDRRIGRFEIADGGTLFLDEIGELPLDVQVQLLQVLENKEFERIGSSTSISSDFRLIVATNRNLERDVAEQRFRADLYYRICVFPIIVPPLRDRREDIPILAEYFLEQYSTKMSKNFAPIPEREMDKLVNYDWPGNIRELKNVIERAIILSTPPFLQFTDGNLNSLNRKIPNEEVTLKENERRHVLWALEKTHWKVRGPKGAAELLGIHPSTLAFRMKKLGIERP